MNAGYLWFFIFNYLSLSAEIRVPETITSKTAQKEHKCLSMNSNAKSVETSLNPSAFGAPGKIRVPALPAAVKKAKNCYRYFHLLLPVRAWVWEAVRPQHRAHHTAVFRELDLGSRALYWSGLEGGVHWNRIKLKKEEAAWVSGSLSWSSWGGLSCRHTSSPNSEFPHDLKTVVR